MILLFHRFDVTGDLLNLAEYFTLRNAYGSQRLTFHFPVPHFPVGKTLNRKMQERKIACSESEPRGQLEAPSVRAIRLRAVIVFKGEVRPLDQYDWRCQWSIHSRRLSLVARATEAIEVRTVEKVEAFSDQLQRELFTQLDVARNAQVEAVVRVAVIAVTFDVGREVAVVAAALPA